MHCYLSESQSDTSLFGLPPHYATKNSYQPAINNINISSSSTSKPISSKSKLSIYLCRKVVGGVFAHVTIGIVVARLTPRKELGVFAVNIAQLTTPAAFNIAIHYASYLKRKVPLLRTSQMLRYPEGSHRLMVF